MFQNLRSSGFTNIVWENIPQPRFMTIVARPRRMGIKSLEYRERVRIIRPCIIKRCESGGIGRRTRLRIWRGNP
jgi:hypothetical protein